MNKRDWLFMAFALLSSCLALITIVIHLKFVLLPLFFLLFGFAGYFFKGRKSLLLFFFLLPLVNSTPDILFNGYPYNYMGIILFYLFGIVAAALAKGEELPVDFKWANSYLFFLLLLFVSTLFVFLRWSNITLSWHAFLKDTPVTPSGERISFASIFPVITLFIFSVAPYAAAMIKKHHLSTELVMRYVLYGFCFSVGISLIQKLLSPDFLAQKWWGMKMGQYNAGFSDFNAFGFFSGALFFYVFLRLVRSPRPPWEWGTAGGRSKSILNWLSIVFFLCLTLAGSFISGSRTAFSFVLLALLFLVFSKRIKVTRKFMILLTILVLVLVAGGTMKQRIIKTADKFAETFHSTDVIKTLDEFSNGRIAMIENSLPIIGHYPLSGVGSGNFYFYLKYQFFGTSKYQDLPLNHYLLVLDENGVIGLVVFIFFLIQAFVASQSGENRWILVGFFLSFLFHNHLWFPEVTVLFFVFIAACQNNPALKKKRGLAMSALLLVFILSNIASFAALHPVNLAKAKQCRYDYGWWYAEKNRSGYFQWSKEASGLFFYFWQPKQVSIFCGAPLASLPDQRQEVDVFWRGKFRQKLIFSTNQFQVFSLAETGEGFMEFRVRPVFNLKAMQLGDDNRALGCQFFLSPGDGT